MKLKNKSLNTSSINKNGTNSLSKSEGYNKKIV